MSLPLSGRRILVTGGNGYIGSHTVIELISAGAEVVIVDSLVNSNIECLNRLKRITGTDIEFHQVDLRDYAALEAQLFHNHPPYSACIHFAGLKAVGESVSQPLRYYEYNVYGAINLFKLLDRYDCRRVVFSSSATVYGLVASNPISESFPLSTTNPYGSTKLVIENILRELASVPTPTDSSHRWTIAILRYFNPIGAHPSGLIGEDPNGIPNNLLPFVLQVAVGRRPEVKVFGNDWPTRDGTGIRDYIHVVDLAKGHVAALTEAVFNPTKMATNCEPYNLGTGRGVSVLEIIAATEAAAGKKIPYVIAPRRGGDIAECYANPEKAAKQLHWKTQHSLEEAVASSWKWQQQNPYGFSKEPV